MDQTEKTFPAGGARAGMVVMIHVISDILDAERVAALRSAALALDYVDGRATAGRFARVVKSNLQAAPSPERDAIFGEVREALFANRFFRSLARPRAIARMLLARYRPGDAYGTHVDEPVIDGRRTDISFTLPLSALEDYEGGALVIEDGMEERAYTPDAGMLVLYPTFALHRVEPVVKGERLVVVGWVTSWVRDPLRREILHDLDVAAREIFDGEGKTPAFDRIHKCRANLCRMWYDD